jgi:Trk K+ transport system NAD-binding subunit
VSDVASDEGFPRSCVIAGIALEGAVQAPRGATTIEAGAQLLVVSARVDLPKTIEFFLRRA